MDLCEREKSFFDTRINRRDLLKFILPGFGIGLGFISASCDRSKEPIVSTLDLSTPTLTPTLTVENRVYIPVNVRGFCYNPYRDGQDLDIGPHPSDSDIKADVDILQTVG